MKLLTYPTRECVRCHRRTHEHRLCQQCRKDDELTTRMAANALMMTLEAFSARLGYGYSLDEAEVTCDYYDHRGGAA